MVPEVGVDARVQLIFLFGQHNWSWMVKIYIVSANRSGCENPKRIFTAAIFVTV